MYWRFRHYVQGIDTRTSNEKAPTSKKQLLFSKYHPNRPCGSCFLCGKSNNYYTHFDSWGNEEKEFITKQLGKAPPHNSCICKAHQIECKRKCSKHGSIPKWATAISQEKTDQAVHQCIHLNCTATSTEVKLITPSFEAIDNLEAGSERLLL